MAKKMKKYQGVMTVSTVKVKSLPYQMENVKYSVEHPVGEVGPRDAIRRRGENRTAARHIIRVSHCKRNI